MCVRVLSTPLKLSSLRNDTYNTSSYLCGMLDCVCLAWTEPWLDLGGGMAPPNFFLNIIKYMDTNFNNFVIENYTFVPLKISLILLRALL